MKSSDVPFLKKKKRKGERKTEEDVCLCVAPSGHRNGFPAAPGPNHSLGALNLPPGSNEWSNQNLYREINELWPEEEEQTAVAIHPINKRRKMKKKRVLDRLFDKSSRVVLTIRGGKIEREVAGMGAGRPRADACRWMIDAYLPLSWMLRRDRNHNGQPVSLPLSPDRSTDRRSVAFGVTLVSTLIP